MDVREHSLHTEKTAELPVHNTRNDADLVARVQAGDRRAFDALMRSHHAFVHAVTFRILGDEADAQDITQECFLRVWQEIGGYDPARGQLRTWMYRIASNLCLDRLRARRRSAIRLPADATARQLPSPEDLDAHICNTDLALLIRTLTARLSPMQKIVFTLRELEECSVQETADITGLSTASVKVHASMARKRIRGMLRRLEKEEHA